MKVYIVVWKNYEFIEFEKAFYSKRDAEKFINSKDDDRYYIEEMEVE